MKTGGTTFDLAMLDFGYHKFAVPREFALKLFNAAQEDNFYKVDERWEGTRTVMYVQPMEQNTMPKISIINPVIFFTGIENQKVADEKAAREAAEKERS